MEFIGGMLVGALIVAFIFCVLLCFFDVKRDIENYIPKHYKTKRDKRVEEICKQIVEVNKDGKEKE